MFSDLLYTNAPHHYSVFRDQIEPSIVREDAAVMINMAEGLCGLFAGNLSVKLTT